MERSITHCEIIPNRIINRNNNYAQRKIIIHKKFEWLNKYLSTASPQVISQDKFSAAGYSKSSVSNRKYKRTGKNNQENNRLKTEFECQGVETSILKSRDSNFCQMRKTSSGKFETKQQSVNLCKENITLCKFFRTKKTKSQFSRGKPKVQSIAEGVKIKNCPQDFEIKPWNTSLEEEQPDLRIMKQSRNFSLFRE